jgi:hypothetical protein
MADPEPGTRVDRVPWQQLLLDDIFLLVGIGLVVPTIFYIAWGLISLASVPAYAP